MGMVVRTNIMATNANNSLNKNNGTLAKSLEKLSSGFRINRAADDASGLAISEKMKAQIKALDSASKNCEDGISLIQTAEGYMTEVHDMLNRMVELSEKSANGTMETVSGGTTAEAYSGAATDRQALQEEMDQLCAEIDRISQTANFNNLKLFDGTLDSGVAIGASGAAAAANSPLTGMDSDEIKALTGNVTLTFSGGGWEDDDGNTSVDINTTYGLTFSGTPAEGDQIQINAPTLSAGTIDKDGGGTMTVAINIAATASLPDEDTTFTYSGGDWDVDPATMGIDLEAETPAAGATFTFNAATVEFTPAGGGGTTGGTGGAAGTGKSLTLQIGETDTTADKLIVNVSKMTTDELFKDIASGTTYTGSGSGLALTAANATSTYADGITVNISNQDAASSAAVGLRNAINAVSSQRAKLGAMQNRIEYTVNNLNTASENMSSANSRIRDTDMAKEMMKYTQSNVLTQAAQAMLAQANTQPQNVLQLLQ